MIFTQNHNLGVFFVARSATLVGCVTRARICMGNSGSLCLLFLNEILTLKTPTSKPITCGNPTCNVSAKIVPRSIHRNPDCSNPSTSWCEDVKSMSANSCRPSRAHVKSARMSVLENQWKNTYRSWCNPLSKLPQVVHAIVGPH